MRAITTPQPLARSRLITSYSSPSPFRAIANPFVDIVVPVLNEEKILQSSIETLDEYMMENLPYRYQITIADNGSQDNTLKIAKSLAQNHKSVRVVRLAERGRGRALKQVWQSSQADVLTYMDVDLSTSLDDFLPMIQPLVAGEAGVAIGSRLMKKSKTSRGFKREFISRCYNKIIKLTSRTKFSDAQCGFKAIRRDVARELGLDDGIDQIIADADIRRRLIDISVRAKEFAKQTEDCFNHSDVRSDNLAFNPQTGELKLVDWNWVSYAPQGSGATEFLVDMARHGHDVTPWLGELNAEMLASFVGFFLTRSLKPPLKPGDNLRQMQALSAAVAYDLLERM